METMMGNARERMLTDICTPQRGIVQKVLVRVGHRIDISQPLVELLGDLPGGDAVNEFAITSPVNGIVESVYVQGGGIHRADPGSTVLMTINTDAGAFQRLRDREREVALSSGSQPPETQETMAAAIAQSGMDGSAPEQDTQR